MTLPSSPPIAASQIRDELGLSDFRMDRTAERNLAEKPSGGYSFHEFLGKSIVTERPIEWTGSLEQTIDPSSSALSVEYVIRADGMVTWNWTTSTSSDEGLSGYWTYPPVFENDGIQVRAVIEEGGEVDAITDTWVDLNTSNSSLSISKTTGSPTTLRIEIRRNGGDVLTSWRVTLTLTPSFINTNERTITHGWRSIVSDYILRRDGTLNTFITNAVTGMTTSFYTEWANTYTPDVSTLSRYRIAHQGSLWTDWSEWIPFSQSSMTITSFGFYGDWKGWVEFEFKVDGVTAGKKRIRHNTEFLPEQGVQLRQIDWTGDSSHSVGGSNWENATVLIRAESSEIHWSTFSSSLFTGGASQQDSGKLGNYTTPQWLISDDILVRYVRVSGAPLSNPEREGQWVGLDYPLARLELEKKGGGSTDVIVQFKRGKQGSIEASFSLTLTTG